MNNNVQLHINFHEDIWGKSLNECIIDVIEYDNIAKTCNYSKPVKFHYGKLWTGV